MAPRLLLLGLAAALGCSACVWPAEYYLVPEPENYPPLLVATAVTGANEVDGVVLWDTATTPELTFELRQVDDQDLGDWLYVRWLVAYDPAIPRLARGGVLRDQPIKPSGSRHRRASFTLSVSDANDIDATRGTLPGHSRPYLVEVLVANQEAPWGNAPVDFGTGVPVVRWRWVVSRITTGGN